MLVGANYSHLITVRVFTDAAFFFDVIATLVDAVPLGTFSSRESAVEWISDGDHHTPIVLSSVICDHCKLLLVDSFVRNLFNCAIGCNALGTDEVLRSKNDKDLKHEKDLAEVGTSSATSLAASEARVDRSKSFWKSSKWARKLSSGVVSACHMSMMIVSSSPIHRSLVVLDQDAIERRDQCHTKRIEIFATRWPRHAYGYLINIKKACSWTRFARSQRDECCSSE